MHGYLDHKYVPARDNPKPMRKLNGSFSWERLVRASRERLPSTNELVDVLARRLESRPGQHTNGTNPDGGSTPNAIREVGSKGVAGKGSNVLRYYMNTRAEDVEEDIDTHLNSVQQTQSTSLRFVEEGLPLGHRLERIHQRAIETVRRRSDEADGGETMKS